jgi:hypothetical protein
MPKGVRHTAYEWLSIPQAKCGACRAILRVLPVELLPRKVFSFPAITAHCGLYLTGPDSLRRCVAQTSGDAPCFHDVASVACGPGGARAGP